MKRLIDLKDLCIHPGIPNDHLKPCYDALPALQAKVPPTILRSLADIRLNIWDGKGQKKTSMH